MKKLNMTKEQFNKSRYFQKKYGKLEYVSESGRLFKTNKGKVLKFKESKQVNEELFSDIGSDIGHRIDNGISGLKKMFRGKPKFKVGDELEWKYPKGDEWYPFVVKDVQWIDGQWRYGDENAETYRPHGFWSRDYWHPQGWCRPKQGTSESTKKFGRKFKESSTDDIYGFYKWLQSNTELDSGIHVKFYDNEDGGGSVEMRFDDRYQWDDDVEDGTLPKEEDAGVKEWIALFERKAARNGWEFDMDEYEDEFSLTLRDSGAGGGYSYQEGTESNPRFKCMEDVGVTSSSGAHYATFLADMVAGFLEKQRGIDDVEYGDEGILVTFSDGGRVAVSFDSI